MFTLLGGEYIQNIDTAKIVEKEKLLGGCDAHARNDHPHHYSFKRNSTNGNRRACKGDEI